MSRRKSSVAEISMNSVAPEPEPPPTQRIGSGPHSVTAPGTMLRRLVLPPVSTTVLNDPKSARLIDEVSVSERSASDESLEAHTPGEAKCTSLASPQRMRASIGNASIRQLVLAHRCG